MSSNIPFFERTRTRAQRQAQSQPDPRHENALGGASRGAPAAPTLHANLERLVQGRQLVEKWLVFNKARIICAPRRKGGGPAMPDLTNCNVGSPMPWVLFVGRSHRGGQALPADVFEPLPIPKDLVYSAPMSRDSHNFSLWSESNGKMMCPTFDLPAGSNLLGGSCPGANAGQSVVSPADRGAYLRPVGGGLVQLRFAPPPSPSGIQPNPVELRQTICEHCYATENNYQMATNLIAMTVRYFWVRQLVKYNSELLIETLVRSLLPLRFNQADIDHWGIKPVRIHSSGDFFNLAYLEAWIEVANRIGALDPSVRFWAPTRIWAAGQESQAAARLRNLRFSNFALRASAYNIGDPSPGPLGGQMPGRDFGAAQGSTSCYEPHKKLNPDEALRAKQPGDPRFQFDCSVYKSDEAGCPKASENPTDNKKGCRACWIRPDLSINYTTH